MNPKDLAEKYCIFKCLAGSHAYGTATPTSDVDIRGVFIAPPEYVLSCTQSIEQVEYSHTDTVIYELRKFLKLAADCNPNIIELLFTDDCNILHITDEFKEIRNNRHLFLSKKAKHTFSGYAMAQLKRIKGHNKWINNPQDEQPPSLADFCRFIGTNGAVHRDPVTIRTLSKSCFLAETFGTTQFRVYHSPDFFADKLGFFSDNETQPKYVSVDDDTLARRATYKGMLWVNMSEFKARYKEWKDYWSWKNNRNEDRAKLEEQFGFDCKHAMHLVRLMRMAQEIMENGDVVVLRPDAGELLGIRNGEMKYDELIKWASEVDEKLNDLYEKSELPHSANYDGINSLYRTITMKYWELSDLAGPFY